MVQSNGLGFHLIFCEKDSSLSHGRSLFRPTSLYTFQGIGRSQLPNNRNTGEDNGPRRLYRLHRGLSARARRITNLRR